MRRPTSDARQRESRRSSLDNPSARRRNSSVPFHNARMERNPNSLDSDTDFLCDRAVEFMESGDIHSIVAVELAEQSMYFERLLRYHKGRGYIRLPEFLNSGFSSVIEFIRKGTTEITPENVYHIFIAADYLLVPKLKTECADLLKEMANTASTAIMLWVNCRALYWPEVGAMAFQKILENFETVWPSPDFQQLEPIDVWRILQEDGLNCKREKTVFDACNHWISGNFKIRLNFALDLLLCVRLGMMTAAEVEIVKNHELTKAVPDYNTIIQDWPRCLTKTINPLIKLRGRQLITPRLPHEVVMVFGGWCDGEGPRAAAQVYNPRANAWTLWTESGPQPQAPNQEWLDLLNEANTTDNATPATTAEIPSQHTIPVEQARINAHELSCQLSQLRGRLPPDGIAGLEHLQPEAVPIAETSGTLIGEIPRRVYAGCVLIGTRVYLVGGFDGTNALKSTLCYDFEIDSGWYEISCMYEKRYYVSVAYANNHIYALGGHNGENQGRLDTAERYTLEENLWQTIASMNRVRSDASAAELGGRVYVAGGFEGRRYHDSAEYYEPESNQWTLVSRMHSPRGGISLAQHGGYLYAIGGNDGNSRLRTIERYDMNEGKWELVGQMNRRKSNLSSTVVNDDIYILGGWSDEPEAGILDLVERFDTTTRECHTVRQLTFPASATCACTLKDRNLVKKYIRPLPISSTQLVGPTFVTTAEFAAYTNQSAAIKPVDSTANGLPPLGGSTKLDNVGSVTPSITGQRNTNSQLSTAQETLPPQSSLQETGCCAETGAIASGWRWWGRSGRRSPSSGLCVRGDLADLPMQLGHDQTHFEEDIEADLDLEPGNQHSNSRQSSRLRRRSRPNLGNTITTTRRLRSPWRPVPSRESGRQPRSGDCIQ